MLIRFKTVKWFLFYMVTLYLLTGCSVAIREFNVRFNPNRCPPSCVGVSLAGKDFSDDILWEVDFTDASLERANFANAELQGALFPGADLTEANFRNADLTGADLASANLNKAKFSGATLDRVNLNAADMSNAVLSQVNLEGVDITAVNFSRATLIGVNLTNARLSGAQFANANLNGAILIGADLSGADLTNATLDGANMRGADLSGANLTNASLQGVQLNGGNLAGARLQRASLVGTDLRLADLEGANLQGAILKGASMDQAILKNADLSGANLNGAILTAAILDGAIFATEVSGDVWGTGGSDTSVVLVSTMNGTSLSRASFRNTCLAGAFFTGAGMNWTNLSLAALENSPTTGSTCSEFLPVAQLEGASCNPDTTIRADEPYQCAFRPANSAEHPSCSTGIVGQQNNCLFICTERNVNQQEEPADCVFSTEPTKLEGVSCNPETEMSEIEPLYQCVFTPDKSTKHPSCPTEDEGQQNSCLLLCIEENVSQEAEPADCVLSTDQVTAAPNK